MRKITYNPDQLKDVANLVWQYNRYLKQHPFIKNIDDVYNHMLHSARDLVCDHTDSKILLTMGYCVVVAKISQILDEYEVEFLFDPSVGAEDPPFITVEVDKIGAGR